LAASGCIISDHRNNSIYIHHFSRIGGAYFGIKWSVIKCNRQEFSSAINQSYVFFGTLVGWIVGCLALAAMQSTGAAYMSTFSGMMTRDVFKHYFSKDASDKTQKFFGRIFVVIVAGAALIVAAKSTQAIVMLGGLAVAYGFQMYPALIGLCYFPKLSTKAVVFGLIAGLIAVTLTDKTSAWFGVPWGSYPLTIHSAGWGILINLIVVGLGTIFFPDSEDRITQKKNRHKFIQSISGLPSHRKKIVPLAWVLTLIWFIVGFGPFATIGNALFSNPNNPITWFPIGLPSLWVWQLIFLLYGIFVMWFLAFYMGLSKPIDVEKIKVPN
jgi:hypothetical protein